MKANETKLIRIIEGTNQYLIPHFQRPYTWQRKNWDTLWADIAAVAQTSDLVSGHTGPRDHFMGAIVTAPAHSVPEGVTKYLLVDGQQRLTTLLLLLAAIRDRARHIEDKKLADRIHDLYLTNRYQDGLDQYKLLPTQGDEPDDGDRSAFIAIVNGKVAPHSSGALYSAFQHFTRLLRNHQSDNLSQLSNAILSHVLVVSIVLERDDNPYSIFESLNAKGQPLSQSDLVRNFFFMSIDARKHDEVYRQQWIPMERMIDRDNMETFIRHFLIRDGSAVREADVYYTLKQRVEERGREHAEVMLADLVKAARFYARFLNPELEPVATIRDRLMRIQRLRATVSYPFLLKVFEDRASDRIGNEQVNTILDVIENFIVRRYVCGTIRAELNDVFTTLYRSADRFGSLTEGVKEILGSRNYPMDQEFCENLQARKLYGPGEARERAKLILERLEASRSRKEQVVTSDLTIEHIMPQTLSAWWRQHLGPAYEEAHELYLHTIGNLTLTGYNAELSNADFPKKREWLKQSKVSLNADITVEGRWTGEEIAARAQKLAELALQVWPNFAPQAASRHSLAVTGTTPRRLEVLGASHEVQTWQDVLRLTLGQISELGEDVLREVGNEFPRYVSQSASGMRTPRSLARGWYYESHLNAEQIHRLCFQIAQRAGLSALEWVVETE